MKKLFAVMCAALLLLGLTACGNKEADTPENMPEGATIVRFDEPEGYEKVADIDYEDARSYGFEAHSSEEDPRQAIGLVVKIPTEEQKIAIPTKKLDEVEDAFSVEFAENLKVEFIDWNQHPGFRVDEYDENGTIVEYTYYLLMGDWLVVGFTHESPETLETTHEDLKTLLDSLRVEAFEFTNK